MMRFLAIGLRFVAALMRLLPLRQRVALLSRQNGELSLDFELLRGSLEAAGFEVAVHVMKPEMYGKRAFLAGTLQQLELAVTSRVVVMDGYLPAVCIPKKRPGVTVVQMWHAAGAIKKFGYQCLDTDAGRSSAAAQAACMHENYDVVVAGGPGAVDAYAQAFGYGPEAVRALGLPHFDYLLDDAAESPRQLREREIAVAHPFLVDGKQVILYAPTLRKGEGYGGWLSANIMQLAQACPSQRAWLVVTGHPLDADFDQGLLERYPQVRFVPGASTTDLVGLADCVVSDYSAVALDAGIAGKPVLFYVPDIEQYRASPGLNIDPLDDELLTASTSAAEILGVALDAGALADAQGRYAQFIEGYFEGTQGGATQRVVELIAAAV